MGSNYRRGLELLAEVDGEGGVGVIESLSDVAPDVGRYIVEFAFGEIYNREALSLRDRELATIASLCALGGCEPQLTSHAKGNMNLGNDKAFLMRVVSQCLPYIGYPRSLNAVSCINKAAEM